MVKFLKEAKIIKIIVNALGVRCSASYARWLGLQMTCTTPFTDDRCDHWIDTMRRQRSHSIKLKNQNFEKTKATLQNADTPDRCQAASSIETLGSPGVGKRHPVKRL